MKKMLFILGLTILTFGAFAEKTPSIVVNKQQGGFTALFNLYNYVHYTPSELSPTGVAQLDCTGSGFSACRVPNCSNLIVNEGSSITTISDAGKVAALMAGVNNVIVQFEAAQEQNMSSSIKQTNSKGSSMPSVFTKTIAMANGNNASKMDTYVVRGVVTSCTANSSTLKIYIEKANILTPVSGN